MNVKHPIQVQTCMYRGKWFSNSGTKTQRIFIFWTFTSMNIDTIWIICQFSHMWILILRLNFHRGIGTICLNFYTCEYWYYMLELSHLWVLILYVWTLTHVSSIFDMTHTSTCITCHGQTEAPADHSPKHILFPCLEKHLKPSVYKCKVAKSSSNTRSTDANFQH